MRVHFTVQHRREQDPDRLPRARTPIREVLAFAFGLHEAQRGDRVDPPSPRPPQRPGDVVSARHLPRPHLPHIPYPVRLPARITAVHSRAQLHDARAAAAAGLEPVPEPLHAAVTRLAAEMRAQGIVAEPIRIHLGGGAPGAAAAGGDAESTMAMPRVIDFSEPFEARLELVDAAVKQRLRDAYETAADATGLFLEQLEREQLEFDAHFYQLFPEAVAQVFGAAWHPTSAGSRVPQVDGVTVPFAPGRRRAVSDRQSVEGLYPALSCAPARHALPGGAR